MLRSIMGSSMLDQVVALLNSHNGRDKAIRTVYYGLIFYAGKVRDQKLAEKLLEVAKQLSIARLIGRQFGDILLLYANLKHWAQFPNAKVSALQCCAKIPIFVTEGEQLVSTLGLRPPSWLRTCRASPFLRVTLTLNAVPFVNPK